MYVEAIVVQELASYLPSQNVWMDIGVELIFK